MFIDLIKTFDIKVITIGCPYFTPFNHGPNFVAACNGSMLIQLVWKPLQPKASFVCGIRYIIY